MKGAIKWSLPILVAVLLVPILTYAGGLWNETEIPITPGSVIKSWERSPLLTIKNGYNTVPEFESVIEKIILYPDNTFRTEFVRRTGLSMAEYAGQDLPMYHPETGMKIGTYTVEELGVLLYSITKHSEDERIRKEALAQNPPVLLCYNTAGVLVVCP